MVSALKSVPERKRQGDLLFEGSLYDSLYKFQANQGYLVRACLKTKHKAEGLRNSEGDLYSLTRINTKEATQRKEHTETAWWQALLIEP